MNVYTVIDHDIRNPVGGAFIVVAENEEQARELLDEELIHRRLKPYAEEPYTLIELETDVASIPYSATAAVPFFRPTMLSFATTISTGVRMAKHRSR